MEEKNTDISYRITQLVENEGINLSTFAAKMGYLRPQVIYDMMKNRSKPSFDFFLKFFHTDFSYKYSIRWIVTGEGEMLQNSSEIDVNNETLSTIVKNFDLIIETQKQEIEKKNREIDNLKKEITSLSAAKDAGHGSSGKVG